MTFHGSAAYPPPKRRLRLGFVGGGRGSLIGKFHALGARLSNRWEALAGALSSDPEVAMASGRDWMLPEDRIYADYVQMAEVEARRLDGIEAVVIATPNWTHRPIAEAFLTRGIDVICDKPLTTKMEDAIALVKLQRETGLVLGVTYVYAFHPMVRQARELVRGGRLGRIRQVHVEYLQDWATGPEDAKSKPLSWRRDPERMGRASAAADIGTHAFHLAHYITGLEMQRCRADFHVCGAPKAMEDTAIIQARYEDGVIGTIFVSQAAPGNHCALRIRIFGEEGGLQWDQENPDALQFSRLEQAETLFLKGYGAGIVDEAARMIAMPRGHPEGLPDAWGNLYTEFAIAVEARRNGHQLPEGLLTFPDVLDGLRGMRFVDACADSHEAGGVWIECEHQLH